MQRNAPRRRRHRPVPLKFLGLLLRFNAAHGARDAAGASWSHRKWSEPERAFLMEAVALRASRADIARALARSPRSVITQTSKLRAVARDLDRAAPAFIDAGDAEGGP